VRAQNPAIYATPKGGDQMSPPNPEGIRRSNHNVLYRLLNLSIVSNIIPIMARTEPPLLPRVSRLLRGYGENLKLARLRRRYSAETVAQRAGITRKTLGKVEKGDSAVALGIYARVMQVLRLEEDLAKLAVDDPLGRKLQDAGLSPKRRAPKRRSSPTPSVDNASKPMETS
jgi:transcriptional regulator with XRE-family HTH domain